MKNRCPAAAGLALTLMLSGCAAVGPDFEKPEADIPEGWTQPAEAGLDTQPQDLVEWWKLFDDPIPDDVPEQLVQAVLAARRDESA